MQGLVFDAVYMRSDSDYRPDFVVKTRYAYQNEKRWIRSNNGG